MSLLEVRNVSKTYRSGGNAFYALRNVSLTIEAGEFVALTGRSGSGKSTLLNICGAMDFPSEGAALIDGESTSGLSDKELTRLRREKVGFIFQSFQLLHNLSVIENVEVPLLLARVPNPRPIALERLHWVELGDLANRLPHQLSGGQQQRVAIARALVHAPKVVLADEPTGNLDTTTSAIVLDLLARCTRDFGAAVVMATHNPESARDLTRTIHLQDGCLERVSVPFDSESVSKKA
jgi:ABC-type lipoprotein export system ATPase subunit